MRSLIILGVLAVTTSVSAPVGAYMDHQNEVLMTNFNKITPVLLADDIEACVRFWNDLGFETTMTAPFEGGTGFAALSSGDVELMYQSFAMSQAQDPNAIEGVGRAVVYLEVRSLAHVQARLSSAEIVVPVRETGHGTRELHVRDPAGNLIGFAEPAPHDDS